MAAEIQIDLNNESKTLRLSQRAKFRMSESGAFTDAQTPGKEFSFVCKTVAACLEPNNSRITAEVVADWIPEDGFLEVANKLGEFLSQEKATPEKKPGTGTRRGSRSNAG